MNSSITQVDDIVITPFAIDRVLHSICEICGSETEIAVGHDIVIQGASHEQRPLKALVECPLCGFSELSGAQALAFS